MKQKELKQQAILTIEEGEDIAGMWITSLIPTIGFYKLLAKKKKDNTFEWVHFIERENSTKEVLYRGSVQNEDELKKVLDSINIALGKTYGKFVKLTAGKPEIRTIDGRKSNDDKN
jgi:hypothetical protein